MRLGLAGRAEGNNGYDNRENRKSTKTGELKSTLFWGDSNKNYHNPVKSS